MLMLSSGADGADYQRFLQEESGNVAADGMFSIQVHCLSLTGLCSLSFARATVDSRCELKERPTSVGACPHSEMPCTTLSDALHHPVLTTQLPASGVSEYAGHQQGAGGVGPDLREP